MIREKFTTGTILEAGWEPNNTFPALGTLEIKFASNSVYRYKAIPKRIWEEFRTVGNRAVYFAEFIRGQYQMQVVHQEPSLFGGNNAAASQKKEQKAKKRGPYKRHHRDSTAPPTVATDE